MGASAFFFNLYLTRISHRELESLLYRDPPQTLCPAATRIRLVHGNTRAAALSCMIKLNLSAMNPQSRLVCFVPTPFENVMRSSAAELGFCSHLLCLPLPFFYFIHPCEYFQRGRGEQRRVRREGTAVKGREEKMSIAITNNNHYN